MDFNMEQRLWTLALIPSPGEVKVGHFHGETEGDGTLEGDFLNIPSSTKLPTMHPPPVRASRIPSPPVTGGDMEDTPPLTT